LNIRCQGGCIFIHKVRHCTSTGAARCPGLGRLLYGPVRGSAGSGEGNMRGEAELRSPTDHNRV
jgi:hypothetical protein